MSRGLEAAQRKLDRSSGETIRYWQAQRCACWDPVRQKGDKSHALCGGTGVYRVERDVSKFRVIIANVSTSRAFVDIGAMQSGDLLGSAWPDEIPLAPDDRIAVLTREASGQALLTRGAGASDVLPVEMTPLVRIENVAGRDGDVTTGWSQDGDAIAWTGGVGVGQQYSVRFVYLPTWQVVNAGTATRVPDLSGARMPRRVGLTLVPIARPEQSFS